MTSPESCIFYQDSKCLFKGGSCDLKCNPVQNASETQTDEIDKLIEWRAKNKPDGKGNVGLKSG
jgi:hypothetical protein